MGKYDNVTMKEYMKKKKEMLNDFGRVRGGCEGVRYYDCPFYCKDKNECDCDKIELNKPDKALEIVMEYEPKVDWSKVEVDTKVLVRNSEFGSWCKRYFAKYEDGKIYTYPDGLSSFTYDKCIDGCLVNWDYAKLYKGDE